MATDPRERAELLLQAVMLSMSLTEADSAWTHDDWDEAMAGVNEFRALSAELVEARRERDDAQARLARLEEALRRIVSAGRVRTSTTNYEEFATPDSRLEALADIADVALSGGVAAETRDGEAAK